MANSLHHFVQTFKKDKKRRVIVDAIIIFFIILCYLAKISITKTVAIIAIIFCAGLINIKEKKVNSIWLIVTYSVASFIFLYISQVIQNEGLFHLGFLRVFLGLLCILIPFLILVSLTMKPLFSFTIVTFIYLVISIINVYIYEFRGSEFCPADILCINVALNVISKYTYVIYKTVLMGLVLYACLILVLSGIRNQKGGSHIKGRIICLIISFFSLIFILCTKQNVSPNHFLHGGSYNNGFILNYILQIEETFVTKPADYSPEKINEIAEKYITKIPKENENTPDIIVIMDEAFSDLRVYGDGILNTNTDIMPYIDSMKRNTTKGFCLSSVYGGGTPNSEYEFLSGNSLLFLNGIVYQQFINSPAYSLVSELKQHNYYSLAMHPYLPNGYKRDTVWPLLGFDQTYFLDHFPQKNLIRGLVSDQEML